MDITTHKAQNIISMSDFKPDTGFPALSQVEAYWDALRGNRLVPSRSDVDPRGIDNILENAFVLERVAVGIARLRVAGTHLSALMGMEVRGMPLTSFFAPSERRRLADTLEEMFQTPATCTIHMTAPGGPSRPELDARMILLPLKSDLGDISRALGCLVAKGDLGAAPRRFEIKSINLSPLIPGDGPVTLPAPLPPAETAQQEVGFAEPDTPFDMNGRKKRPPYLRLVKSDD